MINFTVNMRIVILDILIVILILNLNTRPHKLLAFIIIVLK